MANEAGNLPRFFRLWQTWDDSCDVRFFVTGVVPKILRYDFDKHYAEGACVTPELAKVGQVRYCVYLKDSHFTIKEKIQRYCCRVLWLMRNCGYGFAFWGFGRNVRGSDMVMTTLKADDKGHFIRIGYDKSRSIWTRPWMIHHEWPLFKGFCTKIYLGWKVDYKSKDKTKRAMVANRVWFKKEG